jgi:predicted dehydrogenase
MRLASGQSLFLTRERVVKTIKVGVIGAGGIAQAAHLPSYQSLPGVEVAAVADLRREAAEAAAAKFGIPKAFRDYRKLLALEEIEAVSVCTPNAFHKEQAVAALEAGKHVLVEKPMAVNAREGAEMIAAAKKAKRLLMVALNLRFASSSQALKRAVAGGALGEIYYAEAIATRRRGIPGWGAFTSKSKSGGGALLDIGVHSLDLTLYLMGFPKPVAVSGVTYAKLGKLKHSAETAGYWGWDPKKFDVDDFGVGLVRFSNGATLFLKSSWAANIGDGQMNSVLVGTEGGAELSPLKLFREEHGSLVDITPVGLPQVNSHQEEVRLFIEAIRRRLPSPIPGEEAILTTKILDGIYRSSQTGREVKIS